MGAGVKAQGLESSSPGYISYRVMHISYLHSDGSLLGHSLVHADEGYVVV